MLRKKKEDSLILNLTPLIDVIFLLLLFFVLASTLTAPMVLDVNVPAIAKGSLPTFEPYLIQIDQKGQYVIDKKRLTTKKELALYLSSQAQNLKRFDGVSLAADSQAPHHSVMAALDLLGQLGIVKVQLVAQISGG